MNYENWCSCSNPGHVIIVVDQNEYMGEVSSNGQTFAQRVARCVNCFLSELFLAETMGMGTRIPRKAKITIIGYGGVNNNVSIIHNQHMDLLWCDDKIPRDTFVVKVSDGTGRMMDVDYDIKRYVSPIAIGSVSVVEAFKKVKTMIIAEMAFSKSSNREYDPVPIVLHLSTNVSPRITKECEQLIDSIKRIKLADGSPLIMNCILTKDDSYEIIYPNSLNMVDNQIKSFYDLSSQIPETFIRGLIPMGYPELITTCKALTVNPNEFHALDFGLMQFGGSEPHIWR